VLVVAQGPRADCERLLELLRGGSTPGSVDKVVADITADFTDSGEPMTGFRER
jgi:acylphosphatase